jgi:hypothetical protein
MQKNSKNVSNFANNKKQRNEETHLIARKDATDDYTSLQSCKSFRTAFQVCSSLSIPQLSKQ